MDGMYIQYHQSEKDIKITIRTTKKLLEWQIKNKNKMLRENTSTEEKHNNENS